MIPEGAVLAPSRELALDDLAVRGHERGVDDLAAVLVSPMFGAGGGCGYGQFAGWLGAAVWAVDSGWMPHTFLVGQTGATVSPQLSVANGISDAMHPRAGRQTSKTIVAVKKDEGARLIELMEFGVVDDLHIVLSGATEQITARRGQG